MKNIFVIMMVLIVYMDNLSIYCHEKVVEDTAMQKFKIFGVFEYVPKLFDNQNNLVLGLVINLNYPIDFNTNIDITGKINFVPKNEEYSYSTVRNFGVSIDKNFNFGSQYSLKYLVGLNYSVGRVSESVFKSPNIFTSISLIRKFIKGTDLFLSFYQMYDFNYKVGLPVLKIGLRGSFVVISFDFFQSISWKRSNVDWFQRLSIPN